MPRYVVIDTETSGLPLYAKKGEPPPAADAPGQPRLVSFTALVTTPDLDVDEDQSISVLVRPNLIDGVPEWQMQEGATAVNGITTEMALDTGIDVRDVLTIYSEYITQGCIVVCHNRVFDLKVMRGELRRVGMPDLFEQTLAICTMDATRDICKLAPSSRQMATGRRGFKQPKLMEAYHHFYGDFPQTCRNECGAGAFGAVC